MFNVIKKSMTEKKKTSPINKKINHKRLIQDIIAKEKVEQERINRLIEQRTKEEEQEKRAERKRTLDVIRFFIETWDRTNPKDINDDLNKPMKLDEWLNSPYDINDFCNLPDELIDLKEEYVSLKEPDLRDWTLYKFVMCYEEFLISEIKKIIDYKTNQKKSSYTHNKIQATGLGTDEYYIQNQTFNNFVDIAIDEDQIYDRLPELKEDLPPDEPDSPNYLRPKYFLKKKKWWI